MRHLGLVEAVFTTVRVEHGKPVWLSAHLARLIGYADTAGLPVPVVTQSQVYTHTRSQPGLARLRISQTRKGAKFEIEPYKPPRGPLRVGIYPEPVTEPPIKTLPYDHRHKIRRWALEHSYDDALTISPEGYLLEGAYANLLWMHEGEFYTPSPDLPLLEGLYLQHVGAVPVRARRLPRRAKPFLCNCLHQLVSARLFYPD